MHNIKKKNSFFPHQYNINVIWFFVFQIAPITSVGGRGVLSKISGRGHFAKYFLQISYFLQLLLGSNIRQILKGFEKILWQLQLISLQGQIICQFFTNQFVETCLVSEYNDNSMQGYIIMYVVFRITSLSFCGTVACEVIPLLKLRHFIQFQVLRKIMVIL